jgi:hypothetical protein
MDEWHNSITIRAFCICISECISDWAQPKGCLAELLLINKIVYLKKLLKSSCAYFLLLVYFEKQLD